MHKTKNVGDFVMIPIKGGVGRIRRPICSEETCVLILIVECPWSVPGHGCLGRRNMIY